MSTADADDVPTVPYFLILLQAGPNRAAEPEHRAAHIAFIETMEAANVVLLGGEFASPVDGAQAAYLLRVSSQSEAERWAAKDPLVVAVPASAVREAMEHEVLSVREMARA